MEREPLEIIVGPAHPGEEIVIRIKVAPQPPLESKLIPDAIAQAASLFTSKFDDFFVHLQEGKFDDRVTAFTEAAPQLKELNDQMIAQGYTAQEVFDMTVQLLTKSPRWTGTKRDAEAHARRFVGLINDVTN